VTDEAACACPGSPRSQDVAGSDGETLFAGEVKAIDMFATATVSSAQNQTDHRLPFDAK
jgi:hypothetical protein